MIERLTPEQTAWFPEFVEKWIKIGLSTELADRPRAEAAIKSIYEVNEQPLSRKIIWFDDPQQMFSIYAKTNPDLMTIIDVRSIFYDDIIKGIRNVVGDTVDCMIGNNTWHVVYNIIRNSVRNSIWKVIGYRHAQKAVYGSHEAHWLAELDFYQEVLGLIKETNRLTGLSELVKSCGWIIPCEKI
jgi:hypothetical protein